MEDKNIDYQRILAYLRLYEDAPALETELDYSQLLNDRWNRYLNANDRTISNVILSSNDQELDSLLRVKAQAASPKERVVCLMDMKAQDKNRAISELAKYAAEHRMTRSQDGLYFRLLEREAKMTTAIGEGVAIPHVNCPSSDLFSTNSLLVAISRTGIDFDAPDKRRVRLFFVPCTMDAFTHIRLMARIAKFLHKRPIVNALLNTPEERTALEMIEKNL